MTTVAYDLNVIAAQLDPGYSALRMAAEMFRDHQDGRTTQANRMRSLTVDMREGYADYVASMKKLEDRLSARLVDLYYDVAPEGVVGWAGRTAGVGKTSPHLLARLLGQLGHPRLAIPKYWVGHEENGDEPLSELRVGDAYLRSVGELWQYCGHGEPKRLRPNMSQDEILRIGSVKRKSLVHLISESVIKAQVRKHEPTGGLGALYLETKERYRSRVHNGPCPGGTSRVGDRIRRVRCKVDGRYAEDGDPYQPSHIQAIALRRVGKEILKELWLAAEEPWT